MLPTKHILMVLGSYDQSAHEGIAKYASQHGWHLNISILKDFQLPENWQGDGIITSLNDSAALENFVLSADVPVVDLSIWRKDIHLPRVVADNAAIGRLGAKHFIETGHQYCAWFALAGNPVSQARYEAYRDALAEAGVSCIRLGNTHQQDTSSILDQLLKLPKPCAVYAKSDYDAAWILNLCLGAGLQVPDDVALLGADDNALICENQVVPLSSVQHDLETIGYEGAAMLDRLIKGEMIETSICFIPPKGIRVRQSTDTLAVSDKIIRKLVLYLKNNYRDSISTDALADLFQISRRSLETRFRQEMHCSIRECLIRIRIAEAKRLLATTKESIETIAALTGFCHAPHFSNTFRKAEGRSPTLYRRLLT
ncbi:MAG: DNA-binding transcriptional regulator [Verrucomicrobiota bacterium]